MFICPVIRGSSRAGKQRLLISIPSCGLWGARRAAERPITIFSQIPGQQTRTERSCRTTARPIGPLVPFTNCFDSQSGGRDFPQRPIVASSKVVFAPFTQAPSVPSVNASRPATMSKGIFRQNINTCYKLITPLLVMACESAQLLGVLESASP